jgi:hypothetical protein
MNVTYIEKNCMLLNHVTERLVYLIPGREILGLTLGTKVGNFSYNLSSVSKQMLGKQCKRGKNKFIFLKKIQKELHFLKNQKLLHLIFSDEQVIISITEDNLQKTVYNSNKK